MRPNAKAALQRVIDDAEYRLAVKGWIASHSTVVDAEGKILWQGKTDADGHWAMNICSGGPPVTVALETIQFVIYNGILPVEEKQLVFPKL